MGAAASPVPLHMLCTRSSSEPMAWEPAKDQAQVADKSERLELRTSCSSDPNGPDDDLCQGIKRARSGDVAELRSACDGTVPTIDPIWA